MSIYVKAHRRGKSMVKAHSRTRVGYAVTSKNRRFGRAVEATGLSKRDAQRLKSYLRRGDAKGTMDRSTYFMKPFYGKRVATGYRRGMR